VEVGWLKGQGREKEEKGKRKGSEREGKGKGKAKGKERKGKVKVITLISAVSKQFQNTKTTKTNRKR
jgi:hypothetical protein